MKKIILICSLLLSGLIGFSQAPIVPRSTTSTNTVLDSALFIGKSFRVPVFADTSSANNWVRILDSAGKINFTYDVNSFWIRKSSPKRWVQIADANNISTIINNTSVSNVTVQGDSLFIVCYQSGSCDTSRFSTSITNINSFYLINDTSLVVCHTDTLGTSCDTVPIAVTIPPTFYQNGVNQNGNIVEFGTDMNKSITNLQHNTILNTEYSTMTFRGQPVFNYPYQFYQNQYFQTSTGIASFLSHGYGISPSFVSISARLGINFTGDNYNNVAPNNVGYYNNRIGYWMGTNTVGYGSFGLRVDDNRSKNVGIFFNTYDSTNTDAISFFGTPQSLATNNILPISTLYDYKILTLSTDRSITANAYGSSSSYLSSDTSANKPAAFDANGKLVRLNYWPGSGGSGASVATTLPIINKSSVANGLTINLPYIQDGGTSSYTGSYNINRVNTSVLQSDFTDGVMAFNYQNKDSVFYITGGWNTIPTTTDTVRQSLDGGVTWTFKSKLPYSIHTVAHIMSIDGYAYWFGGDYLCTATQKKTVFRTNDFSTFTTMTTNAGFGARILQAAWEWNGMLFVGGGQSDLVGTVVYNDIWYSTDGGANWSVWNSNAVASNGDSVMKGNAYNSVFVYNKAIYRVMVNVYPNYSNKRVYKSLDGGLSWVRISDYPYSVGASYPSGVVWDGKLWVIGGYSGSNTSNVCYLDKSDTWHVYYNYVNNNPADTLTPTHASDAIIYGDRILHVLGNNRNSISQIFRSNQIYPFIVRDSIRINRVTYLSETTNAYRSIFGNGVTSYRNGVNDLMVRESSDPAWYIGLDYSKGFNVFGAIDSTIGVTFSDTAFSRFRVNAAGNVRVTKGYFNYDPGSAYAFASNGKAYINSTTLEALVLQTNQNSSYIRFANNTVDNGLIDYTNGGLLDLYTQNNLAARFSNTSTRLIPLSSTTAIDTTTYKPVAADASGNLKKMDSWPSGGTGGITGSGANHQITYWTGASTVSGSNNFTYNGADEVKFISTAADAYLTLQNSGGTQGFFRYVNSSLEGYVNTTRRWLVVGGTRGAAINANVPGSTDFYVENATNGQDAVFTVSSKGTGGYGVFNLTSTAGDTRIQYLAAANGINYFQSANEANNANKPLKITGVSGGQGSTLTMDFATTINTASTVTFSGISSTAVADTTNYKIVAMDASGNIRRSSWIGGGGGTTYTASNGITLSTADFQLGGTLSQNTTINTTANYTLKIDGAITSATGDGTTFEVANSSNGTGILVNATNGIGITSTSTGNNAFYGSSTSGAIISGYTTNGIAAGLEVWPSSTNTVITNTQLQRASTGTAANGIGESLDFFIQTTAGSGSIRLANQLISKLTDATDATRTSQFIITGVNSGTIADLFTLSGNGNTQLNKYGVGTFSGTTAYNISVDASGNLIETSNLNLNYYATAVDYTVEANRYVVNVTATGKTITLPTAVGIAGRIITVKLTASGSGTIATTSSQTIDGSTTYSLSAQYKFASVMSDGANWIIIANN